MPARSFMKVKMSRTCYGSPDGMRVAEYKKGETVDLPDALAEVFVQQRWAVAVDQTSRRKKDQGAAPENKSAKPPRKRKTKCGGGGHGA